MPPEVQRIKIRASLQDRLFEGTVRNHNEPPKIGDIISTSNGRFWIDTVRYDTQSRICDVVPGARVMIADPTRSKIWILDQSNL